MPQLDPTERILRLRMVPVFRTMPAATLAALAGSLRPRTFERGEALLREGEPPRSFFLVSEGVVRMERKGRRIGTVRAPGGVGFLPLLARDAGATRAVAQSFVDAYEVPGEALEEIFEDDFSVLLATMRWIADRLLVEMKSAPAPPFVPPDPPWPAPPEDRELGLVERIYLLRQTRAYGRANVNSLARIARRMKEERHAPGAIIWSPGDPSDSTCFVVAGMGRLLSEEGQKVQIVGPGYVVGGTESLLGVPRWNAFVADEPVLLLRGQREAMIDTWEDDRELAGNFLALVATFLVSVWDRKAEQGLTSIGAPDSVPGGQLEPPVAPGGP